MLAEEMVSIVKNICNRMAETSLFEILTSSFNQIFNWIFFCMKSTENIFEHFWQLHNIIKTNAPTSRYNSTCTVPAVELLVLKLDQGTPNR